jgi:hypothetical protein
LKKKSLEELAEALSIQVAQVTEQVGTKLALSQHQVVQNMKLRQYGKADLIPSALFFPARNINFVLDRDVSDMVTHCISFN